MEKKKITRKDLPVLKGKIEIEFIEINGKKINLTPSPHSAIENYITHENCIDCGNEFEKRFTYEKSCKDCQNKKESDKYFKLELIEWDGETPLFDYESDNEYFFSLDEVSDYCDENDLKPTDLMLVTCVKTSFPAVDLETITDSGEIVHEDWEPSKEFEDKLKEFNAWLTNQNTNTWLPGNKRVSISEHLNN